MVVITDEVVTDERTQLIEAAQAAYPTLDLWMIEGAVDLYLTERLNEKGELVETSGDPEPDQK